VRNVFNFTDINASAQNVAKVVKIMMRCSSTQAFSFGSETCLCGVCGKLRGGSAD